MALALVVGPCLSAQQTGDTPGVSVIDLDGRAVRVQALGLDDREPGTPVLVFEAGAGNSIEIWGEILERVAPMAPVVAYDRAGLGRSEWDEATPSPRHVSDRLRRVLGRVGADPPYVLVGFSWGGMLVRYFAGYHPDDVVGLVLVDPGPMVTEPLADNLRPFEEIGAGRDGFDAYWSNFAAVMAQAPAAMRAELEVFRDLLTRDPAARDLHPAPAVPLAVIVAGKALTVPIQVPFDLEEHFAADLRYRLDVLGEWVLASPHGTLVLAGNTTHLIPREDPGLVVAAVERVLGALR